MPLRTVGGRSGSPAPGSPAAVLAGLPGPRVVHDPVPAEPTPAAGPAPVRPAPVHHPPTVPAPVEPGQVAQPLSSFVRPYVLTRGRTRSRYELSIETMVSAAPTPPRPVEDEEHRAVIVLCADPRSVAEIAAIVQIPLGVARVLVGDLADSGAVIVHRTVSAAGPDLALMERILGGLRRL